MSGSLGCEGTKNRPKSSKSADYSARRIAWPREAVASGLLGLAEGQTTPEARQGLSRTGLAWGPPRRRQDMVILTVTSSVVNAERNWTATP
jgi:hypothetical protein